MNKKLQAMEMAVDIWRGEKGWSTPIGRHNTPANQLMFIEFAQDLIDFILSCGIDPTDAITEALEGCPMDYLIRESLFGSRKK
jgi:hypothetical protein